jgi:hypothetical protein
MVVQGALPVAGSLPSPASPAAHIEAIQWRGPYHDADHWPFTEPPWRPPPTLHEALHMPLRPLAGCWIDSHRPGCRHTKTYPIRWLLTERRERAEMGLRRAVHALRRCPGCQVDRRLALVSDPQWQSSKPAGKPPHWSLQLTGRGAGTAAFTAPPGCTTLNRAAR